MTEGLFQLVSFLERFSRERRNDPGDDLRSSNICSIEPPKTVRDGRLEFLEALQI